MRAQYILGFLLLLLLAIYGCAPYTHCRYEAFARASNYNQSQGPLVSAIVQAIHGPPDPHPPLDDMLAACEPLR